MKKLFLFSILIILLTSSCRRENNNLPEEIVWSYAIESADSEEASFIYDPIIYDNIVVIPRFSFRDNIGELIALDKVTGEVIWKWQEAHDKYDKDGFSQVSYVYDGILAIGDNNYTAGLNIYTGETIWENLDNVWGSSYISFSSKLFTVFRHSLSTAYYKATSECK